MSSVDTNISHAARSILKRVTAQLSGRERGPDHGEGRRVPRRDSYEENDPKAKPWSKVGDGSVIQGIMHKEALVDTAEALQRQLWLEYPKREERARRREREELALELERLGTLSPAEVPVGATSSLIIRIREHDDWLTRAAVRLRRIDINVLRGLLSFLTDFATGQLFPEHETIAEAAGVHRNTVVQALKRLRTHGLVEWVRRTTRTGRLGEAGPQLEQTSNGCEIAPRRRMAARTWQTYWQRLCLKLRRLGPQRPADGHVAPDPAPLLPATPYQAAFASFGASVISATT